MGPLVHYTVDKVTVLEVKNDELYFHFRLCHYILYKNDFTFYL